MKGRVGTSTSLRGSAKTNPKSAKGFLVACPRCGAKPSDKCDGLPWSRVHPERVEAYKLREKNRRKMRAARMKA